MGVLSPLREGSRRKRTSKTHRDRKGDEDGRTSKLGRSRAHGWGAGGRGAGQPSLAGRERGPLAGRQAGELSGRSGVVGVATDAYGGGPVFTEAAGAPLVGPRAACARPFTPPPTPHHTR